MQPLQRVSWLISELSRSPKPETVLARWPDVMAAVGHVIRFSRWCLVINVPCGSRLCAAAVTGTPVSLDAQRRFWDLETSVPDANKAVDLAKGPARVALLGVATRGELGRSPRWEELLGPQGIGDELRMVLLTAGRWWGSLALYRESDEPFYTRGDATRIAELAPSLADAARATWINRAQPAAAPPEEAGVMLVDDDGEDIGASPAAKQWLTRLDPATQRDSRLIDPLRSRLKLGGGEDAPVSTLVRDTYGSWVKLAAARLDDRSHTGAAAITFQRAPPSAISDVLLHAYPLTTRERQIAYLAIDRPTTREIGEQLRLSHHTVAGYLKSIFVKTGIHNRYDLTQLMTGRSPP